MRETEYLGGLVGKMSNQGLKKGPDTARARPEGLPKNISFRAGVMAQPVNTLLPNHEDRSSDLQHCVNKCQVGTANCL